MSKKRILIVDDEHITRHTLEALLQQEGYDLTFCDNGQDALNQLDELAPDVILLDVMMPNLNGFEVCRLIKANEDWRHIPVILVTALASKKDLARGIDAGADDFLSKPVSGLELGARVRSMLRIKAQYDQLQEQRRNLEKTLHLREELARFTAQRLEELELLHKVGLNLMNSLDINYIIELIGDTALKLIPTADRSMIHFLSDDEVHFSATIFEKNGAIIRPDDFPEYDDIVRYAIDMREAVHISDLQAAGDEYPGVALPPVASLLIVPLVVDGRPIGTLGIDSQTPQEIEVARRRIMSILSSQLAVSIMKARLFNSLGGVPAGQPVRARIETSPLSSSS